MNLWTALDRILAITSAPWRRLRSDDLVADILDGLAMAGRYRIRVDLVPMPHVLDFNWAAHEAGRRLGIRVRVDALVGDSAEDGRRYVTVTAEPALG